MFNYFNFYQYAILCEDWFYHHQEDAGKVMTILTTILTSLSSFANIPISLSSSFSSLIDNTSSTSTILPKQNLDTSIIVSSSIEYLQNYIQATLQYESRNIHHRLIQLGILEIRSISNSNNNSLIITSTSLVNSSGNSLIFRYIEPNNQSTTSNTTTTEILSLSQLIIIVEKIKNSIRQSIHQLYKYEKQLLFQNALLLANHQRNTIGTLSEGTLPYTRARHNIQLTYDILLQLLNMVHPSHMNKIIISSLSSSLSKDINTTQNTITNHNKRVNEDTKETQKTTDKRIKNSPFSSIQRIFTSSTKSNNQSVSLTTAQSIPVEQSRVNTSRTIENTTGSIASSSSSASSLILPSELLPIIPCTINDCLLNSHPLFSFLYILLASQLEISLLSPHIRIGCILQDSVILEAVPSMPIARIFIPAIVNFLILTLGCICNGPDILNSENNNNPIITSMEKQTMSEFRIFPIHNTSHSQESIESLNSNINTSIPIFTTSSNTLVTPPAVYEQLLYIETIVNTLVEKPITLTSILNNNNTSNTNIVSKPVIKSNISHSWELSADLSNRLINNLLFIPTLINTSTLIEINKLSNNNVKSTSTNTKTTSSWSIFSSLSSNSSPLLLPPLAIEYSLPSYTSFTNKQTTSESTSQTMINNNDGSTTNSVPVDYTPLVDNNNSGLFKSTVWKDSFSSSSAAAISVSTTPNINKIQEHTKAGKNNNNKARNVPSKFRLDCVAPGQWYYVDDIRTNIDGAMDR